MARFMMIVTAVGRPAVKTRVGNLALFGPKRKGHTMRQRWDVRSGGGVLGGCVLLVCLSLPMTLSGCVTNPATGERVFNTLSPAQEIQLGEQAQGEFIASNGGNVADPELLAYVRSIGEALAAVSERPELPWEFHLLDSSQINAFALPGGKVFMSRGLMERMTNEAQLAGVLGHEIGHVTALHVGQRISRQRAIALGGAGLTILGGATENEWLTWVGLGTSVGGTLVYLPKFSRDNEREADALGVRYMEKAGYNPYGQVQVMQILKEAARGDGSANLIERMLATHPLPQDRIERLEKLIASDFPSAERAAAAEGFYAIRFEEIALSRLRALPAPTHKPGAEAEAAALRAYAEHMLATGDCCDGHHDPHGG